MLTTFPLPVKILIGSLLLAVALVNLAREIKRWRRTRQG